MDTNISCASPGGPGDSAFGPVMDSCVRKFDFTLLFEDTILSILPSSIFIILAALRMFSRRSVQHKVANNTFRQVKLASILVFTAISIALTTLWARAIAAAVLTILDSVFVAGLSFTEHSRSLSPSLLLNAFLVLSTIFDAVRLRTLWIKSVGTPIVALSTATFGLKLALLVQEEASKRRWIIGNSSECSSEETAGLFNRVGFHWLNGLLLNGYKSPLSIDKLPVIDRQLLSDSLWNRVGQKWRNSPKTGNNALLGTIFSALKWPILAPVPAYMILVGLQLAQPFMISTIMAYLASPVDHTEDQRNIGYGLIGAYGLVYVSIAVRCQHLVFRITGAEEAAAVTLMSTDIERIVNGMSKIHESWSTLLQMAVALALLYRQLGVVFIVPLVLFLICAFGAGALSGSAGAFQASWMAAIQKRVAVTSSVLGAPKGVKLSGFTDKMFHIIQDLHLREIASAAKFRTMLLVIVTLSYAPGSISPVVTFGAYTAIAQKEHTTLDSNRIFTSLALLALVTQPLNELFAHLPNIIASIACFGRVQAFLLSPETAAKSDVRSPSDNLGNTSSISESRRDSSFRQESEKQAKFNEAIILDPLVNGNAIEIHADPALTDLTLHIPHGKLTMIVGPVASGKSTLLKPILGETPVAEGTIIRASDNIAFCDQVPWLTNETLRRNVTGFSHFEASWYSTVVRACALEEDIATFPDGDQVMVGSKGVTLSGGQKQRVAIARAVYSRREIILFDDVFSGLDFETQTRVFNKLFGLSGLLRQRNATALFVTHAVHILPQADYIITLDQTGTIASRGTFEELNKQPGYISKFGLVTKEDTIQRDAVKDDRKSAFKPEQREKTANSSIDEDTQRMGDRSVYKYYFQATGPRSVLIFITLQVIWVFLTKFPEIWLSWWGEANDRHPNQETGKYMGVYATLQVLSLILSSIHQVLLLTSPMAPLSFFATTNTGSIVNRFSRDIQLIDAELPISLLNVAANGLICIAQALMIIPASYQLITVFPLLGGVLWVIQRFYLRTSRQLRFLELDAKAPMYSQFLETLSGLSTICAFGWQQDLTNLMRDRLDTSQKPMYLLYSIQRWLTLVLDLTVAALAIVLISVAVALRGRVGAGFAGVALYNIMGLSSAMKAAITVWTVLETSIGTVARVKTFAEQTPAESQARDPQTPSGSLPERGAISFHNVTASYGEGMGKVLSKVSFGVLPGQKVGICGRSGSGKSSLLLTLLRLIDCDEGQVIIDGVDVATMPREVLRQRLNALPQEPPFFSGSVRLNCDPEGAISDEIITEALRTVGLWEVIEEKGGLDAEFSDDFFSHGQKQVFCLARGILCPTKIVVMDEATSNVDVDTEKKMMKIIHERFAHATIISVAHRLDTVLDFDKIIILDKGVIVEEGCPAELLGRASAFRALYETFHT
ncbi:P-loop containing nucleoside triphosphate hydrolase protein [Colletotrichum godetiae]|uniref:P-loop containing nucleoside triphosphate hydrolase protein n=1 Tax=Colletotrichum godetiae TaxID=1209918 RepID=A0AAJ0ANE8_9PEZI|nr:P-loop containing nucleoside triphosphate hydrolase protein [Colletotrichum godetiae]KAK1675557.1 P-loop containing nucleoside triphosphate hydrolase protein [Colletotrichum godetiae]